MEDDAATFVTRLRQLGVPNNIIRDRARVAYIHPDEALKGSDAIRAIARAGTSVRPALVVIDGVSEAMTLEGLNIDSTGDVALFHADMPRRGRRPPDTCDRSQAVESWWGTLNIHSDEDGNVTTSLDPVGWAALLPWQC
jgi:hypothetical protein